MSVAKIVYVLLAQADALQAQVNSLRATASAIQAGNPAESSDPVVRVVDRTARACTRRRANSAAKSGEIKGAVKVGKHWCARESAIDMWLSAQQPTPEPVDRIDRWTKASNSR